MEPLAYKIAPFCPVPFHTSVGMINMSVLVLSVVTLVAAWFTQTATSPFLFTCHDKVFYRACDAASSISAATSFGLET